MRRDIIIKVRAEIFAESVSVSSFFPGRMRSVLLRVRADDRESREPSNKRGFDLVCLFGPSIL